MPKLSKASLSSMKLPKNFSATHLVLIVLSVIFAGLTIYFAVSYFKATSNKSNTEKQITQKQQQIKAIGGPQNIAALLAQLDAASQDLIDESPFPDEINNTDVAYTIIQAAREASITCFEYNPSGPAVFAINNSEYIENRYSISSSGPADSNGEKIVKITHFLDELETAYDTATITGVGLSDGEGDGLWTIGFTYSVLSLTTSQQ
jgi:hypothetical protein